MHQKRDCDTYICLSRKKGENTSTGGKEEFSDQQLTIDLSCDFLENEYQDTGGWPKTK